jgi:hypothetical protein
MTEHRPVENLQVQRSISSRPLDLGLLGARAAIVLDERARGAPAPLDAVWEFGQALAHLVEEPPTAKPESQLQNRDWPLNTALLFQRALASTPGNSAQTIEELLSNARETANRLKGVTDNLSRRESAELRDICLELSESAQALHANSRAPMSRRPSR